MNALPPVVLLDLDDTIVRFNSGPRDFWREAYDTHADAFAPHVDADTLLVAVNAFANYYWSDPVRAHHGRMDLVAARRAVLRGALAELGLDLGAAADRAADHFTREKEAAVAPFEGAVEVLEALRTRGVRMGLVTNGSSAAQRDKLRRYGLERFFDAVLVEGEFGVGKPHAAVFREALARMGAGPADACMVGDNLSADIAGAQAVGIPGVWHDHARAGLPPAAPVVPDRTIHHLSDLL